MWTKFNIAEYKIPRHFNSGFTIDQKNNSIINIDRNYKIKLPFNVGAINELYYFELLLIDNTLKLKLIINTELTNKLLEIDSVIPFKNNLFKILKKSSICKNNNIYNFNEFNNINYTIKNKYSNINCSTIINIDNLYFDLVRERIFKNKNNLIMKIDNSCNLFFLFGSLYNINNNKYKICIIDDNYKLIESLKIDHNNYMYKTKEFFDNQIINIDKNFFFSSKYKKRYIDFHTNKNTKYAYDNYKRYIKKKGADHPIFNIELFDNFIVLIKDIDIILLKDHPILYSNNYIFINNCQISQQCLKKCNKIFKKISKNNNLNYNLVTDNHIYLDKYRYYMYSLYQKGKFTTFNIYDIECLNFNIFYKNVSIDKRCSINCEIIGNNTHAKFDCKCKNSFLYKNLWIYLAKNKICPYCSNKVENVNIFIDKNNKLEGLLGDNFNRYKNFNYFIYLYDKPNILEKALREFSNFTLLQKSQKIIDTIKNETLLIIDSNIDYCEIINNFCIKSVRNIKKIIKFSPSI